MRHQFTVQETKKGLAASLKSRAQEFKIKKKELKDKASQFMAETLLKVTEPSRIPYIAAFTFGMIAGDRILQALDRTPPEQMKPEDLKIKAMSTIEFGLAATIAYGLCSTPQQASIAGNAPQILGAGILGGIGLGALLSSVDWTSVLGIDKPPSDVQPSWVLLYEDANYFYYRTPDGHLVRVHK